jgi:3-deoxy-D-manno-octulosonic-acid transferase
VRNPWSLISEGVFAGLRLVDAWAGLPRKAEASLHYRLDWKRSLPAGTSFGSSALWIHGASVGELEDLAAFFSDPALLADAGYSPDRLVLTASSISAAPKLAAWGRELGLRYAGPLPPESEAEMRDFFSILKPDALVLSHGDVWPLALEKARELLPRGALWLPQRRPEPNRLQRACLPGLVRKVGLREGVEPAEVLGAPAVFLGNPRLDRIALRIDAARSKPEHALEKHGASPERGRVSLVVGSCWTEDAEILSAALDLLGSERRGALQIVVFPHEVRDNPLVGGLQRLLPEARVLPVEGVLLEAYRDFSLAFVGGGFRTGLHSVLEPALWERPTLCGPLLRKQPQAPSLRDKGLLKPIESASELAARLDLFLNPASRTARDAWEKAAASVAAELLRQRGASARLAALLRAL